MTERAPKGLRLHIGIFGRRNVGKSSLLNAITRQRVSNVSEYAGTPTDPVEKPMELLPLGPVLFIDTAGIDDIGALGEMRVRKTRKVFQRTDIGILVAEPDIWGEFEDQVLNELALRRTPTIVVFNKTDLNEPNAGIIERLKADKRTVILACASEGKGILDLRDALVKNAPDDFVNNPTILSDLVGAGEMAVLVVPVDKEAPKGRLILPQVQSIRDLLDGDAFCLVVKERELKAALDRQRVRPKLVVTDSQAFLKVSADTPPDIPMTSFSILFSRFKGDLATQAKGALAIETLQTGDRILIAEACTHHPIAEDIGRVKLPRWLTQYVGGQLSFDTISGNDWPDDVSPYKLVIHCGACTFNRRGVMSRILQCHTQGVAITNYGLAIAYSLGILERALGPFPAALDAFLDAKKKAIHSENL